MNPFPRKPLLDRIIVREIPVEAFYQQPENLTIDLDNANIKIRSDRGEVVAVGDCIVMGGIALPMPVAVGDIVFFDEFCQTDPVYLNPADQYKPDLPKFWQMRVADLKGVDVENRNRMVDALHAQNFAKAETAGAPN